MVIPMITPNVPANKIPVSFFIVEIISLGLSKLHSFLQLRCFNFLLKLKLKLLN